jgi:proteasome assembly chaperone (PAC2) family protein
MLATMPLYRIESWPIEPFVDPVLVAAFDGWVDAAGAATAAAEHLSADGSRLAVFDADVLWDYRSRRPTLDIVDGSIVRLTWPALEVHRARLGERDLLVLHGAEPDFRWKELGADVLELCRRLGVTQWISLGAIPAAVAHTRPVPVLATASRDGLLHGSETRGPVGLLRVPSACLSAVEHAVNDGGLPSVGFFAQVPHYVGGPFAAGTVALLQHLSRHLEVPIPLGELESETREQRQRLDAAVEADEDVREVLHTLEDASDEEIVPSGDELAAEIERFLRTEGPEPGGGAMPPPPPP